MNRRNPARILAASAMCAMLGACATVNDSLFPGNPATPAAPSNPVPQAGTAIFAPVAVTPGAATGTAQGAQVASLRSRLVALQGEVSARNATLSEIRQRTAGEGALYRIAKNSMMLVSPPDPVQAQKAQAALERFGGATAALDGEIRVLARGNAEANRLMTESLTVKNGSEEDQRQLNTLRGEIGQTANQLDRMVNDITSEWASQTAFLAKERASLAALGIAAPPPLTPGTGQASNAPPPSLTGPAFVTIRFDRANVSYRNALAQAVSTARKRKPDASFDVVGVSAGKAVLPEATANATSVVNTLTSLGVDPTKIRVFNAASQSIQDHEVRIYAR